MNRNFKTPNMMKWAKDLFPLCRSLTGKGTQATLRYFQKLNPSFKIIKFKSGKKVFDWKIPLEWNINDAFIKHESGKKFADFKKNNLHVVNYSLPIKKKLNKKNLIKNIYTQKGQPDAIPYVTSYYKKRWGFCLSENEFKKLPSGNYDAVINSSFKKGAMELMHAKIKGKSSKEIFFSSYVCHPSMANNELSGPVVLNALMLYLKKKYPVRKYSYRFVLLPETIGSIAYIAKFRAELKKNIIAGYNITCVGDRRAYSLVHTPSSKTLADVSLESALNGKKNVNEYPFLNRGSDERQYCSPLVNLPVCCFSRSKYYPEYHTDKDNLNFISQKGLSESLEIFQNIIDAFEIGLYPKTRIFCEPNLSKRNLYPSLSQKNSTHGNNMSEELKIRWNLIAYANGKNSIFFIGKLLKVKLRDLLEEYKRLKKEKIIS